VTEPCRTVVIKTKESVILVCLSVKIGNITAGIFIDGVALDERYKLRTREKQILPIVFIPTKLLQYVITTPTIFFFIS
jgi:hypothetical protein